MNEKMIEAIVASPPERDELVVQLFLKDGGQWGEIFREDSRWWIELYQPPDGQPLRLDADEVLKVIDLSLQELKSRMESS